MTEPARSEVHADPDVIVFEIAEKIDVVIARADRAELGDGLRAVVFAIGRAPQFVEIEQLVLNALVVGAADAE